MTVKIVTDSVANLPFDVVKELVIYGKKAEPAKDDVLGDGET